MYSADVHLHNVSLVNITTRSCQQGKSNRLVCVVHVTSFAPGAHQQVILLPVITAVYNRLVCLINSHSLCSLAHRQVSLLPVNAADSAVEAWLKCNHVQYNFLTHGTVAFFYGKLRVVRTVETYRKCKRI